MADFGKLWFEMGVRDNVTNTTNIALKAMKAFHGEIDEVNKSIKQVAALGKNFEQKDIFGRASIKNAMDYQKAMYDVRKEMLKLLDLRRSSKSLGIDTKGIDDAFTALNSIRREMRNLFANGDTDIDRGMLDALRQKLSITLAQVRDFYRVQTAENKSVISATREHVKANMELVNSYDKVVDAGKRTNKILDQMKIQMASAFSLYAVEGLLKSVIQIGGEFEVQHIALKSILGDVEQANTIFNEIKQLAVVSPFNFSQLISYSKQIAAFNVPYEEMYDTTKRLADMSAGLGVDMGRLILAYGQVRSAAVLRGQELRQFTEAGIPMVQALADEFTKLNGRAVTTGEVFELISKRAVPFEMVKKILWDMTNEGGRFYNMQFTLSDTLAGKWSNLKDAWQIMLSNFAKGESLGGKVLKSLVQLTTDLVESLDKVGPVLGGIAAAGAFRNVQNMFASFKGTDIERNVIKAQQLHAIELKRRYLNQEITREEYNQGLALNKNRQTYYMMLAQEGRLKEYQIARAVQQKKINTERLRERVLSGELTTREAAQLRLWRMKYAQASIFNVMLKNIGLSLKTMMGPFGWMSLALDGLIFGVTEWYLKSEQASDKLNEAMNNFANNARDRQRELSETIHMYDEREPTSDEDYRSSIEAMKQQLKQYDANYGSIMREVDSLSTLKEQYERLKQELGYVSESYRLAGESKADFENIYNSTNGLNEAAKSWATTNDYLNRSLNTLASEGSKNVEEAIDNLAKKMPKLKEILYDENGIHRKTNDILRDFANSINNDDIQLLRNALDGRSAGGHAAWDEYVSVFEKLDKEDKKKFDEYLKNAQKRTLEYDRNISAEIEKIVNETYVKVAADLGIKADELRKKVETEGNKLDQKTKTMLRNYFTQQMSAITDGNQSLMRWVDAQRWTLYFHYDIVTDYTEKNGGLQGIAASAWSRLNPTGNGPLLNNPAARNGFTEKEIKDAFGASGNDVNNAKKVLSQRLHEQENLVTALKTSRDATETQKNEAESLFRSMESDWNQMFTDNWRNLNSKGNPKSGGTKKDVQLEAIKNQVDLYKKFYSELENAKNQMGPGALSYLKENGFSEVFKWEKDGDVTDVTNYRQTINELTKGFKANTEARLKWANSVDADMVIQKRKEDAESMKNYVSELQHMMSVMSENYQTYKKWMDLTGDSELAARLAGVTSNSSYSDYLKDLMRAELNKKENAKYAALTASDIFGLRETDAIKFGKDNPMFALWQEWQKNEQRIKAENLSLYEDAIKNAKGYEYKIADVNRQLEKEIAAIEQLEQNEERRNQLIGNARTNANNKISEIKWEQFKKDNDWGRVFGDLDNMSIGTIKDMIRAMKDFQKNADLSEEQTRAWQKALKDLTDKAAVLDPIQEIADGAKDYATALENQRLAKQRKENADNLVEQIKQNIATDPHAAQFEQQRLKEATDEQADAAKNLKNANDQVSAALNKVRKSLVTFGSTISQLGSSMSSLGNAIGGDLGTVVGGFGSMVGTFGSSMQTIGQMKDVEGIAGTIGNVSAVLSIASAGIELNKQLAEVLPYTENLYEKYAEKQRQINQLQDAINSYSMAITKARWEEHGWISDDPLSELSKQYEIHGDAAFAYYSKLFELQERYVEKSGTLKRSVLPILEGIAGVVAGIVITVGSYGTATVAAAAVAGAALGAASGQLQQASIDALTYNKNLVTARQNLKALTQHKSFWRGEKTQNLEEWVRENITDRYGRAAELFNAEGLINLEVAQAVLDSGQRLAGETEETLKKLMALKEDYDEWEKSVEDYVSSRFSPLAENMTEAIWDWLASGEDALDQFRDYASNTFMEIAKDAVKSFLKITVLDKYEDQLKQLYKTYSSTDGKGNRLMSEEDLMKNVADIAGNMAITLDAMLPAAEELGKTIAELFGSYGYDVVNGSSGSSSASNTIRSVTEGTADLIASYINAIRADVSVNRITLDQILIAIKGQSEMPVIARAQLEQLQIIATNTGRNVTFVEEIKDMLKGNINGANRFQIK